MPIYKIAVTQKMIQNAVVIQEAENEDDAREAVERAWNNGDDEMWCWTDDQTDSDFGIDVYTVEEVKPATVKDDA